MATSLIKKLNLFVMPIYIASFLFNSFYPVDKTNYLMGGFALYIIITGLSYMNSFNKYVSIVLICLGILFLGLNSASLIDFCAALLHNSGVISLLLTIPMLGIVFHYDDYEKYVVNLTIKYMNTELKFYTLTSLITSFFGVFLNLGSIPFVYQLFIKHSKSFSQDLFYKAINRGFFSNMLWAPSCIAVAVIIQYFDLSWKEIVPMGLMLAFLAHVLALIIERIMSKTKEKKVAINVLANSPSKRDSLKLLALVFILIAFVVLFDLVTGKSFLVIMSLVSLTVPIVLAVIYQKVNILKERTKDYLFSLNDKNNEFILFSSIGFFGYALRFTNIGEYITLVLTSLGFHSPVTLIPLFILVVLGLSIIGVHPIITISTIALTIPIHELAMSLEQLAFSLLIGYSLYQLVSPFSTAVLILTSLTHENPLNITIKINKVFVISYIALSTLLLIFRYGVG